MKIAICIPSLSTIRTETALSLVCLTNMAVARGMFDIALINEQCSWITEGRNRIVESALMDSNADYLMWLDSDVVVPPDTLVRLLHHKKDIVGASYPRRCPPYELMGRLKGEDIDIPNGGLVEAELLPMGVMLTKADVFRKIAWPWFFETYEDVQFVGDDYNFCLKAQKHGYEIWCDLDLTSEVGHIGEQILRMKQ